MGDRFGSRCGLLAARQWNNALLRYPSLKERYKQAPTFKGERAHRQPPLARETWDAVLARFEAGETKEAICIGRDGWPTKKQWEGKMARDAAFRARIHAEHARRQREVDWEVALRRFLGEAASKLGIHVSTFRHRCKVDAAYARRAKEALRRAGPGERAGLGVKRAMLQNEIVAAVSAALPRSLPPHVRDDVMSDMVLAVLDGSLAMSAIAGSARAFLNKHRQECGAYREISLDSPIRPGDPRSATWGEMLPSDADHF